MSAVGGDPGLKARFTLDDREFLERLKRSGTMARREAWQIARDFERAERARARAAEEAHHRIRARYRAVETAGRAMAVGVAAGAAFMALSIRAAADDASFVRDTFEDVKQSGHQLFSGIGQDVAIITEQTRGWIDALDDGYQRWQKFLIGRDRYNYAVDARRESMAMDRRIAGHEASRNIGERLALSGSDEKARLEAQVARDLRDVLKQIAEAEKLGLDRAEAEKLRDTARAQAEERLKPAYNEATGTDYANATLAREAAQLRRQGAQTTDEDAKAEFEKRALERERRAAVNSARRQVAGSNYDPAYAPAIEAEVLDEINERYETQKRLIDEAREAEKKRADEARAREQESVDADLRMLEIDELRANGQRQEAERLAIKEQFARRIRDVERSSLDEQAKAAAIARLEGFRDRAVERVGQDDGSGSMRTISAGLAARLGRRVLGAPGRADAAGDKQLAEAKEHTKVLREIASNTKKPAAAVAG